MIKSHSTKEVIFHGHSIYKKNVITTFLYRKNSTSKYILILIIHLINPMFIVYNIFHYNEIYIIDTGKKMVYIGISFSENSTQS